MAHILIIDDEPSILSLFGQFLEGEGYSVALSAGGRDGMNLLRQQKTDLIITDIMMPEMDGLEIIQKVRQHDPKLPVIAISGGMKGGLTTFLPHAKMFGAARTIEKPVPLSTLLATVRELLGTSSAENRPAYSSGFSK